MKTKTVWRFVACLLVLCCLVACNQTGQPSKIAETRTSPNGQGLQPDSYGIWPTADFKTASPESQGVDSNVILQRLEKAKEKGELPDSYLIMRNGYLISESYFRAHDQDTAHSQYSITKSVLSALVGIAIEEGYITGVEQKIQDFFPEVNLSQEQQYKSEMTVEHLLTMTSGIWGDEYWDEMEAAENRGAALFTLEQKKRPGEQFRYDSNATNLLAIALSRAVSRNLNDYAKEKLFGPLGMDSVVWNADQEGNNYGGYGISMTPRDMLRFGYLYLNYGRWEDRQMIPADWVAQSPPQLQQSGAYGRLFWANTDNPKDGYDAAGANGQYISVFPELDMVIVITNNNNNNRKILLEDIKNGVQDTPLQENPQALEKLTRLAEESALVPTYDILKVPSVQTAHEIDLATLQFPGDETPAPEYVQKDNGWFLQGEGLWSYMRTQESYSYPLKVTVTYIPQEECGFMLNFRDGEMGISHKQATYGFWIKDFCLDDHTSDYVNRAVPPVGQPVTMEWVLQDAYQAVTVNEEVLFYSADNPYNKASQSDKKKEAPVQFSADEGGAILQNITITELPQAA